MCNTAHNILSVAFMRGYFYADAGAWLDFTSMFCSILTWHLNFFDDNTALITILQTGKGKGKTCLAMSLLIVNIIAAITTVVHAFASSFLTKSHWKTSPQNIIFKRSHSLFLLTSFVFFLPVFSDAFTLLSTYISSSFSYSHLFAMGNSSLFQEGKAFYFPFPSCPVFALVDSV